MPKKVITKQTTGSTNVPSGFRNFCNAMAESMGGTATVNTSSEPYSASISMSPLGYDNLTIKIDQYNTYNVKTHIVDSQTGMDVYIKGYESWEMYNHSGSHPVNNAFSAVCARDSNNDSVVISVTPGTDVTQTDTYTSDGMAPIVLFVGRDADNNVVYGGGNAGHVVTLCCHTNIQTASYTTTDVKEPFSDVLHLTKMVNYLADGYPEMKSAYISVVRPYVGSSDTDKKLKNQSYYAGGALWFIGGESMETSNLYKPFDPVVKL